MYVSSEGLIVETTRCTVGSSSSNSGAGKADGTNTSARRNIRINVKAVKTFRFVVLFLMALIRPKVWEVMTDSAHAPL